MPPEQGAGGKGEKVREMWRYKRRGNREVEELKKENMARSRNMWGWNDKMTYMTMTTYLFRGDRSLTRFPEFVNHTRIASQILLASDKNDG